MSRPKTTRCEFDDLEPLFDELEDASLGYVIDRLAAPSCVLAGEGDLPDSLHELARARLVYPEVAVLYRHARA